MKPDIARRNLIKGAAAIPLIGMADLRAQTVMRPLPIPTFLDASDPERGRTELKILEGKHDFGTGSLSRTKGFNQNYLGPVVRVKNGMPFNVDVVNTLKESVAVHWHGLHVDGLYDGGPHQEVAPGEIWSPDVPIAQRAGMSWFHSHTHGVTARQVYQGLAGVLLIEDGDSLAADLPKTYGVDDFVIVLQDKLFDTAGRIDYLITEQTAETGFMGDTLVINGVVAPVEQMVPQGLIRLRILNSCNARFLNLSMSDGPLNVIASDGGFLGKTIQTETLMLSPGERYEILVDMRSQALSSLQVSYANEELGLLEMISSLFKQEKPLVALTLKAGSEKGLDTAMPQVLANMEEPDRSSAAITRNFTLNMEDGGNNQLALAIAWGNVCGNPQMGMGINGLPMKMDEINEECTVGQTEIWRIDSDADLHPSTLMLSPFYESGMHSAMPCQFSHPALPPRRKPGSVLRQRGICGR